MLQDKLTIPEFLSGGGEMGQRIRAFDWSQTPIGPVDTWPQSLRTCIRIMLTSRQPIWIGWGKELIKFYNDPYKAIAGGKHPQALGKPAAEVWNDIWQDIAPMLRQVMDKDEGTYVESQLLIMERNGYPEETYYTFSYTPIPGDHGGTAGMICANSDDTDKIISERQLRTLTQLGKSLTDSRSDIEVVQKTIDTLRENAHDFPFAAFYLVNDGYAFLSQYTDKGVPDVLPKEINLQAEGALPACLRQAIDARKYEVYNGFLPQVDRMPKGVWKIASGKTILLPVVQGGSKEAHGFLIVGLNPYRLLDEKYADVFALISDQIATSFANVYSLEEERKRAAALAEIDRAKTIFFSNISHEFRTPLTLLLGPIEEALHDNGLNEDNKFRIEVAYRNALRMQKLVNTLLEFSRIEAGRAEGRFERVDIAALTGDLASTFRSAIEKAGMELQIKAGAIKDEVYVDRDMWEMIILNLVSNAFKYSKQGIIRVEVQQQDAEVQVSVSDTGAGIPEDQLDKIFNRFHRVENTEGRSQEGTGIGLAMVKELVKLHEGSIAVKSKQGEGAVFTVAIPVGKAHIAADKIVINEAASSSSVNASAFVEEALKWLPDAAVQDTTVPAEKEGYAASHEVPGKATVLLVDDNADMRAYVRRLLSDLFEVITAVDGEEAFSKVQECRPDLVLSDVMMPRLDGFGLLKKIRSSLYTKNIPVVFLSARAGEEAKVEGLDAGADDYLVKPFSAKELIGRVSNLIRISQVRQETEQRFRSMLMQAPFSIAVLRGEGLLVEMANDSYLELVGKKRESFIGKPLWEGLPETRTAELNSLLLGVLKTGESFTGYEFEVNVQRNGKPGLIYVNFIYSPLRDFYNQVDGVLVVATEVTTHVLARKKLEEHSWILEQEVKARTAELRALNISLQESNADLQQFAHVTSHDLKEPVRKVKIFSSRLQEEYGHQIPEKGHLFLEKILHATDRIYAMIEGVLTYSTLNAQQQMAEEIDLNVILTNIETDLEVSILQKNASIERAILPGIEGSSILLYQLFYNLINNSLKFSDDKVPPVITISGKSLEYAGGEWVEIIITDNGIGFDQEQADKIFAPFARLHSKDQYEGTGLGLALCRKITDRHHGTITAESKRGAGARFTLMLPVRQS